MSFTVGPSMVLRILPRRTGVASAVFRTWSFRMDRLIPFCFSEILGVSGFSPNYSLSATTVWRRRFCINTAEEMRLALKWPGLKSSADPSGKGPKPYVVPVGIDPSWLREPDLAAGKRLRDKFPGLKGRRLVVCLGRINFKKGLDILANAFARIAHDRNDLHLVVAGPR